MPCRISQSSSFCAGWWAINCRCNSAMNKVSAEWLAGVILPIPNQPHQIWQVFRLQECGSKNPEFRVTSCRIVLNTSSAACPGTLGHFANSQAGLEIWPTRTKATVCHPISENFLRKQVFALPQIRHAPNVAGDPKMCRPNYFSGNAAKASSSRPNATNTVARPFCATTLSGHFPITPSKRGQRFGQLPLRFEHFRPTGLRNHVIRPLPNHPIKRGQRFGQLPLRFEHFRPTVFAQPRYPATSNHPINAANASANFPCALSTSARPVCATTLSGHFPITPSNAANASANFPSALSTSARAFAQPRYPATSQSPHQTRPTLRPTSLAL